MVRWAPLNIPIQRRLETGAVAFLFFFPAFLFLAITVCLLISPVARLAYLVAIAWQLLVDGSTPSQGGRPSTWMRSLPFLSYITRYFSAKLELPKGPNCFDPRKTYIFALHPHGIISMSAIANLVFNSNDPIGRLGVPYRICTVTANFIIPIWREFVLAFGFIRADKASVSWCLQHGISVAIVVGGAKESLQARPGSTELTLASRKGFVRIALQHGSSLVPCFHFGEVELFSQLDNPPGSWVRWFQDWTRKTLGFTVRHGTSRVYTGSMELPTPRAILSVFDLLIVFFFSPWTLSVPP
jgi:2-acylglycerol O-acyltransferase 2